MAGEPTSRYRENRSTQQRVQGPYPLKMVNNRKAREQNPRDQIGEGHTDQACDQTQYSEFYGKNDSDASPRGSQGLENYNFANPAIPGS